MEPLIKIQDFTYDLPQDRIATYPLSKRDNSKLLIYNKGKIEQNVFSNLSDYLPSSALMVFNDTKVVPARLLFKKPTGALVEIFCLEPFFPADYVQMFEQTRECQWKAIVGNAKRWKSGPLAFNFPDHSPEIVKKINLQALLVEKNEGSCIVKFTWDGNVPFSKVLEICGKIPIPPYLHRDSELIDNERYQTLYARYRGSVAAPTAGLHFTDEVMATIKEKDIQIETVCLHVGAGTFLPVKSELIRDHTMHSEPISVGLDFLVKLREALEHKKVISVGTTSTRTLESLYYLGVQCLEAEDKGFTPDFVSQWEPYNQKADYSAVESISALIDNILYRGQDNLIAKTQIIIIPSYKYKIVDLLITNFHQPQSTLLLLIAAYVGEENWKNIYDYALNNDFRFLSYGDSSLLIR